MSQAPDISPVVAFIDDVGPDHDDRNLWAAVAPQLPAIVEAFYGRLRGVDEIAAVVADERRMAGVREAQMRHWQQVLSRQRGAGGDEPAAGVGNAHFRAKVSPAWYMASYLFFVDRLLPLVMRRNGWSRARRERAVRTLMRNVFADMIQALAAYDGRQEAQTILELQRDRDLKNLRTMAGTVADVNETALELTYISRNTRQVSQNSQTIAAAASELVTLVDDIYRNSEGVATDAAETDKTVGVGRRAVEEVAEAIRNISAAVDETAGNVAELSSASEQIGQILTVIDGIAGQTNLLALNATIEAARAGEAGRGFAVVASEVKSLAMQTARSTEDITERIALLRQGMSQILTTMKRSTDAVGAGQAAIAQAASTMAAATGQVTEVSRRMGEISAILHQQKTASAEIAQNIESVAKTAGDNERILSSMSDKVQTSNDRFTELAQSWFRTDSPHALCHMARIDHVLFKKRVVDTLLGRQAWAADQVPDHHCCRLGKWYDKVSDPRIRAMPAYGAVAEPHERVHREARRTLECHEVGNGPGSIEGLMALNAASHEVLGSLEQLAAALDAVDAATLAQAS